MPEPIKLLPLTEVEVLATGIAVAAMIDAISRLEIQHNAKITMIQPQKAALKSVASKLEIATK